jgi:hypothetical protein
MPAGFEFPTGGTRDAAAIVAHATSESAIRPGFTSPHPGVVARLRPAVTLEQSRSVT